MSDIIQELVSKELTDFHCLESFSTGVEAMDNFIQGDFRMNELMWFFLIFYENTSHSACDRPST